MPERKRKRAQLDENNVNSPSVSQKETPTSDAQNNPDNHDALIASSGRAAKMRRTGDSVLDHIGFTTYASGLIYVVAELRKFVARHSREIRHGQAARKTCFFGWIPLGKEPLVSFRKTENLIPRGVNFLDKEGTIPATNITPAGIAEFIRLNHHLIQVNDDETFALKAVVSASTAALSNADESNKEKPIGSRLQAVLDKLGKQDIQIIAFDDQFQDSELVYSIGINHSFRRIVVVFRGSVMGNKDWPTNWRYHPIAMKDLISRFNSKYMTTQTLVRQDNVDKCKMHFGYAKYLFGNLSHKRDEKQFNSKFDKIAATLQALYTQTDDAGKLVYQDYRVCISGHSLGGALAQLLTFALGASQTCLDFLPRPITAVTYASPHVGNVTFSQAMRFLHENKHVQHIRITHQGDLVPVGLSMFYGYTQTGCNLHVTKNQIMKVAGFGNTQTIKSQANANAVACHSMPSHVEALYWKETSDYGTVNGNSKVWSWDVGTVFDCVANGKDILSLPRPYTIWTVEELKRELRLLGLKVSGNKDELIARLSRRNKWYLALARVSS